MLVALQCKVFFSTFPKERLPVVGFLVEETLVFVILAPYRPPIGQCQVNVYWSIVQQCSAHNDRLRCFSRSCDPLVMRLRYSVVIIKTTGLNKISQFDLFEIPCCSCCQVASVVSDSVRPHRWQPTRLPRPWDSPGKNTGVGCHFLLQCMKVKVKSFSRV